MSEKSLVEFMGSMSEVLVTEAGLTSDQAVVSLKLILEKVQDQFGGKEAYIHSSRVGRPARLSQAQKRLALRYHQVNNWSISKIAAEMKVSESTVYRIISG